MYLLVQKETKFGSESTNYSLQFVFCSMMCNEKFVKRMENLFFFVVFFFLLLWSATTHHTAYHQYMKQNEKSCRQKEHIHAHMTHMTYPYTKWYSVIEWERKLLNIIYKKSACVCVCVSTRKHSFAFITARIKLCPICYIVRWKEDGEEQGKKQQAMRNDRKNNRT